MHWYRGFAEALPVEAIRVSAEAEFAGGVCRHQRASEGGRAVEFMAAKMGSVSRMTKYLKPYELKLHFSNKYVRSMVVHKPTSHTVVAATSQEKDLREQLPATGDVAAAAHIAGILAARLKVKDIPAVTYELRKGEKYHGKIKAFVDSLRENGILLI